MGGSEAKGEKKAVKEDGGEVVGVLLPQGKAGAVSDGLWWTVFGSLLLATFWTRLHKVMEPSWVCWDETHFGKMGNWYINRTFFFDVHPPLGKMIIAALGYVTGYNGTHPFEKPGQPFEDHNILGMRAGCTIIGCAIVPFSFLTVWDLTHSLTASGLAAALLVLDIGMLVLNRYILLDPILLFFISGAAYAMVHFRTLVNQPFTNQWWLWLTLTGFMLAGAMAVKFVGLFIVLFVGIFTAGQLWDVLGDLTRPISYALKHFLARAVCLILIPALTYTIFFYIHLKVLKNSGSGDGFFSSLYQTTLEGNRLQNATVPADVAYGAVITLKNHRVGGAYLHSHFHLYPEGKGPKQQQVTVYAHKDDNNHFWIKKWNEDKPNITDPATPIEYVRHGDLIRLEHVPSRRNIHSHTQPAPMSKRHYQVTGYGENGTGDANDVWRIELEGGKEGDIVKTVLSKIKFHHYFVKCVLTSTTKTLPKWGFDQGEVTCNPTVRDPNALWNVEDNFYEKLPNISLADMAPGFLSKFIESHRVMLQGNSNLKPKEGEWTSQPWEWPMSLRGQWFSAGEDFRIFLLGNPIIWWGHLALLVLFTWIYGYNAFRAQRGYAVPPAVAVRREQTLTGAGWLFLGWCLHYIPFYTMGRILYFHHYFPALLFSNMLSALTLDFILTELSLLVPGSLKGPLVHTLLGGILAGAAYGFYLFSPLAYGMTLADGHAREANSTLHHLHWLNTWEF